jgi:hypothetical protein
MMIPLLKWILIFCLMAGGSAGGSAAGKPCCSTFVVSAGKPRSETAAGPGGSAGGSAAGKPCCSKQHTKKLQYARGRFLPCTITVRQSKGTAQAHGVLFELAYQRFYKYEQPDCCFSVWENLEL